MEYENLWQIGERLNEGQIGKIIQDTLEPILYEDGMMRGKKPIYGIVNRNLLTFQRGEYNYFYKYRSFRKINDKKWKHRKSKEENVLGNISGCLQLLAYILQVSNQKKYYPILDKLDFYRFSIASLTQFQSVFHYKCEVNRNQPSSLQNQFSLDY